MSLPDLLLTISKFTFALGLLYFVYEKIIKVYARWWHYKSQGLKNDGIPLPFFGTLLKFGKFTIDAAKNPDP